MASGKRGIRRLKGIVFLAGEEAAGTDDAPA